MADRTVWAVDTPGVSHSPADVRSEVFTAHNGESGLVASGGGGLTVTPGDSTSVRILPCAVVAVSRYPQHLNEAYSFHVRSAVDVQLRPAGSQAARTDAIILRVHDHVIEGTQVGEDPDALDYWAPEVLEGVPSSTGFTEEGIAAWKNIRYPFVLIGIAEVPAGSSAVGDIDVLANVVGARKSYTTQLTNVASASHISRNSSYQTIGPQVYFDVPTWATHATITATVMGAYNSGQSSRGLISGLSMGQSMRQTNWDIDINPDSQSGIYVRQTLVVSGEVNINAARRGTVQDFRLRATNEGSGSNFGVNSGSAIHLRVDFEELVDLGW